MKLRRYCVTVMDNWTSTREFWTLSGARRWRNSQRAAAHTHLFWWLDGRWVEFS